MKKFRILLLVLAMAVFAFNFLTIDYQHLFAKASLFAYLRILLALILVFLLLSMVRKDLKKK